MFTNFEEIRGWISLFADMNRVQELICSFHRFEHERQKDHDPASSGSGKFISLEPPPFLYGLVNSASIDLCSFIAIMIRRDQYVAVFHASAYDMERRKEIVNIDREAIHNTLHEAAQSLEGLYLDGLTYLYFCLGHISD